MDYVIIVYVEIKIKMEDEVFIYYKKLMGRTARFKRHSDQYVNWYKLMIKKRYIKDKVVCISGYFNPLHSGHIDYIREAKKLGDKLIIIVNNDTQVKLKGSIPFMTLKERVIILESLKYVDRVFISIDKDSSVCKSLEKIKPDIFANGGDRTIDNTPERKVCKELNIKEVYNIGGKKTQSSSDLLDNINYIKKPWGGYKILEEGPFFKVKKLIINPKGELSYQSHKKKKRILDSCKRYAKSYFK